MTEVRHRIFVMQFEKWRPRKLASIAKGWLYEPARKIVAISAPIKGRSLDFAKSAFRPPFSTGSVLGKTLIKADRDVELDTNSIYKKFEAYGKTPELITLDDLRKVGRLRALRDDPSASEGRSIFSTKM